MGFDKAARQKPEANGMANAINKKRMAAIDKVVQIEDYVGDLLYIKVDCKDGYGYALSVRDSTAKLAVALIELSALAKVAEGDDKIALQNILAAVGVAEEA